MVLSQPLIWFFVGVAFLIVEMFLPAFILIFFTGGAWVVSLLLLLFDLEVTSQIWIFVAVSLILLFALRRYGIKTFKGNTAEQLDDAYAESKIGKAAVVTKTISPGIPGEIKVMGSFWRAVADSKIDEGQAVVIEKRSSEDGLTFKVKVL